MKVFLGIDLGSTTSKSVLVDSAGTIIGRGITNTRSDYTAAAKIAQVEAEFNSRFTLLDRRLKNDMASGFDWDRLMHQLENRFHYHQFLARFDQLLETMTRDAAQISNEAIRTQIVRMLPDIAVSVRDRAQKLFYNGDVSTTSQFFRDLFSRIALRQQLQNLELARRPSLG